MRCFGMVDPIIWGFTPILLIAVASECVNWSLLAVLAFSYLALHSPGNDLANKAYCHVMVTVKNDTLPRVKVRNPTPYLASLCPEKWANVKNCGYSKHNHRLSNLNWCLNWSTIYSQIAVHFRVISGARIHSRMYKTICVEHTIWLEKTLCHRIGNMKFGIQQGASCVEQ